MALIYTIKGVRADGSEYAHPCEGAYEVYADNNAEIGGHKVVFDCDKRVQICTQDFPSIYIENADGKTVNKVYAPFVIPK